MPYRCLRVGLVVALLALGIQLGSPAPAQTGPTGPGAAAGRRDTPPRLTTVRARHVGDTDRVRFGFRGGLPQSIRANWVETMHHGESGQPVRVAGTKVLMVVFFGLHPDHGSTARVRTAYALPNVITSVEGGDEAGLVTFGLGVQRRTSFTITTLENPYRVVIDIAARFPTTMRPVWLVDSHAVGTGDEPYVVPRLRPIRTDAPAAAALHALFAGPLPQEQAAGLRLVRSRAWGVSDLQVGKRVARARLDHGCTSAGSTVTVADEIAPTLRQLGWVDWVKIYDPGGKTERPRGQVDSIPACLEP